MTSNPALKSAPSAGDFRHSEVGDGYALQVFVQYPALPANH